MAHHPQRLTPRTIALWCAGAGIVITLIAASVAHIRPPSAVTGEATLTVKPQPFSSSISVVGVIAPGDTVDVVAPFDGVVRQVAFEYGRPVVAGQTLLVMDPFELQQRLHDAQAAYLKAAQAGADLASWETGPDVSRAHRAVTAAEMELKATERKEAETKALLDRGLVARSEYDGYVQQKQTQALSLKAAEEDLATTLKKGKGPEREASAIESQNAKARYEDLSAQLAGAVVKASAAGVIVRPPTDKANQSDSLIHVGAHLTRGQLIGSIAKSGALAVQLKLDEADADHVREGQPVSVTGPGFNDMTILGHISSVAGEATAGDPGGAGTTFAANAILDPLTPEQARRIRIGMTAHVTIITYQTAAALVVAPQAVQGAAPDGTVTVRDALNAKLRSVPVKIGAVGPDGVEILSGLKPGDVVVWQDPAAAVPHPGR